MTNHRRHIIWRKRIITFSPRYKMGATYPGVFSRRSILSVYISYPSCPESVRKWWKWIPDCFECLLVHQLFPIVWAMDGTSTTLTGQTFFHSKWRMDAIHDDVTTHCICSTMVYWLLIWYHVWHFEGVIQYCTKLHIYQGSEYTEW